MALVLHGKDKGKHVTIMQYCNDWISIKDYPKVYSITALKFTEKEFKEFLLHDNLGIMLKLFTPDFETRTFKRRKK